MKQQTKKVLYKILSVGLSFCFMLGIFAVPGIANDDSEKSANGLGTSFKSMGVSARAGPGGVVGLGILDDYRPGIDILSDLNIHMPEGPNIHEHNAALHVLRESDMGTYRLNRNDNVEGPLAGGSASGKDWDAVDGNGNLTVKYSDFAGLENPYVFDFMLHGTMDYDSTGTRTDRQRIEIKTRDTNASSAQGNDSTKGTGSVNDVAAREGGIFTYRWKFFLPSEFYEGYVANDDKLNGFFHLFQIKSTRGAENSMPNFTFSIEGDQLIFQAVPISGIKMSTAYNIASVPVADVLDKWLYADVTILYRDHDGDFPPVGENDMFPPDPQTEYRHRGNGRVYVALHDISDPNNPELIFKEEESGDFWRRPESGNEQDVFTEIDFPSSPGQLARAKWGLYRKITPGMPEARMDFADCVIIKRGPGYIFPSGFDPSTLPPAPERNWPEEQGVNWANTSISNVRIKASTHSNSTTYPAANLIDNVIPNEAVEDGFSTWRTHSSLIGASDEHAYWAAIDLGRIRRIDRFLIMFGTTGNRLRNYQIYYTNDSAAYENLSVTGTAGRAATPDPLNSPNGSSWEPIGAKGSTPYPTHLDGLYPDGFRYIGANLGPGKYIKPFQMNIYGVGQPAANDFNPINARYILIRGDIDHSRAAGAIETVLFRAEDTTAMPGGGTTPPPGGLYSENWGAEPGTRIMASSATGTGPAANVFINSNGNMTGSTSDSRWQTQAVQSNTTNQGATYWAVVDLGKEVPIDQIELEWTNGAQRLSGYRLSIAKDGFTAADFSAFKSGAATGSGAANVWTTLPTPVDPFASGRWEPILIRTTNPTSALTATHKWDDANTTAAWTKGLTAQYILLDATPITTNPGGIDMTRFIISGGTPSTSPPTGQSSENWLAEAGVSIRVSTDTTANPGTALIDGNNATTWNTNGAQAGPDNQGVKYWAVVDLGAQRPIDHVYVEWANTTSRLTGYRVSYADDAFTAADFTAFTRGNGTSNVFTTLPNPTDPFASGKWIPIVTHPSTVASNYSATHNLPSTVTARYLLLDAILVNNSPGAIQMRHFRAGGTEAAPVAPAGDFIIVDVDSLTLTAR